MPNLLSISPTSVTPILTNPIIDKWNIKNINTCSTFKNITAVTADPSKTVVKNRSPSPTYSKVKSRTASAQNHYTDEQEAQVKNIIHK
jgi:hypothetical protein